MCCEHTIYGMEELQGNALCGKDLDGPMPIRTKPDRTHLWTALTKTSFGRHYQHHETLCNFRKCRLTLKQMKHANPNSCRGMRRYLLTVWHDPTYLIFSKGARLTGCYGQRLKFSTAPQVMLRAQLQARTELPQSHGAYKFTN